MNISIYEELPYPIIFERKCISKMPSNGHKNGIRRLKNVYRHENKRGRRD